MNRPHLRTAPSRALAMLWLGVCFADIALAQAPTTESAAATGAPSAAVRLAAFEARFRALNPRTRIDSVALSPVPGLYEVVMGKTVAYVEPTARYALFGHVFDLQTLTDLTADRRAQLERVDVSQLPTAHALVQVFGTGARQLHVFADPMCGHCRTLEHTIQGLENTTVYTYPVAVLGAPSDALVRALRCAARPNEAWAAWMLKGIRPADPDTACPAGDALTQVAQALGIQATPTLIAGDGRKSAGAMTAPQLNAWLAGGGAGIQARTSR